MRLRYLCAVVILSGFASPGRAQTVTTGAQKQVMSPAMTPAQAQDELLKLFEHDFMAVATAMPADKYGFAPPSANGAKFDGVRTFAQQVAHVTEANYYFFSKMGGATPSIDPQSVMKLTTKDELLKAAADSFAYAHQTIATITPENAYVAIEGVDGMHTRATVASFAAAHGYDHYGQMVEYLRMNGIIPPGSK
ncbi:MAG TPA: DinB family protein [Acidobacteriaceae bacterium]|jgi:uncharacterized damage-inducible protein DinB